MMVFFGDRSSCAVLVIIKIINPLGRQTPTPGDLLFHFIDFRSSMFKVVRGTFGHDVGRALLMVYCGWPSSLLL